MDSVLLALLRSPSVPNWLGLILFALMAWKAYPAVLARVLEGRRDNTARDNLLMDRYEKRLALVEQRSEHFQAEHDTCRAELATANGRIAQLEGLMMGRGEARQEAQLLDSKAHLGEKKDNGK